MDQVRSNLLSHEENQRVLNVLGTRRVAMAFTVCQLHKASPNAAQWTHSTTGVITFVKDNPKKSYYIRMIDMEDGKVVWDQELFSQFSYKKPKPYFHMFQGDSCTIGLNFADEGEAMLFAQEVERKISQRTERRMARQTSRRPGSTALKSNTNSPPLPATVSKPPPPPAAPAAEVVVPSTSKASKKDAGGGSSFGIFGKKDDKKGKKGKDGKGKIKKIDISGPSNFQHLSHIGWDPVSGFDSNNIAPEWKRLFSAAGVTEEQMQDRDTAEFILNYIEQHGGIEKAVREMDDNNGALPGLIAPPPPPPSSGGQRGGPPPPPPPSSRGGPPPPPPPGSSHAPPPPPSASRAPPPPPSSRSGPPPPPPSGGGPAPPPPPPPPAAPTPPPPPPAGGGSAPRPPPPSGGGGGGGGGGGSGGRGGLLDSIRAGASLKKVEAGSGVSANDEEAAGGGMANALAKALADRSKAIHSDNEDDDFDDEDEDWED